MVWTIDLKVSCLRNCWKISCSNIVVWSEEASRMPNYVKIPCRILKRGPPVPLVHTHVIRQRHPKNVTWWTTNERSSGAKPIGCMSRDCGQVTRGQMTCSRYTHVKEIGWKACIDSGHPHVNSWRRRRFNKRKILIEQVSSIKTIFTLLICNTYVGF